MIGKKHHHNEPHHLHSSHRVNHSHLHRSEHDEAMVVVPPYTHAHHDEVVPSCINSKNAAHEQEGRFDVMLQRSENRECFDCGVKQPRWASTNLGIFFCLRCAGVHRSLGTHVSKVKSTTMDAWDESMITLIEHIGNARGRVLYEYHMPATMKLKDETATPFVERVIRAKYERKEFYHPHFDQLFNAFMNHPIINGGGEADVRQFGEDGTVLSQTNKAPCTNTKKSTTLTDTSERDTIASKNSNNKFDHSNDKCTAPLDELWVSPTRSQIEPWNDMENNNTLQGNTMQPRSKTDGNVYDYFGSPTLREASEKQQQPPQINAPQQSCSQLLIKPETHTEVAELFSNPTTVAIPRNVWGGTVGSAPITAMPQVPFTQANYTNVMYCNNSTNVTHSPCVLPEGTTSISAMSNMLPRPANHFVSSFNSLPREPPQLQQQQCTPAMQATKNVSVEIYKNCDNNCGSSKTNEDHKNEILSLFSPNELTTNYSKTNTIPNGSYHGNVYGNSNVSSNNNCYSNQYMYSGNINTMTTTQWQQR